MRYFHRLPPLLRALNLLALLFALASLGVLIWTVPLLIADGQVLFSGAHALATTDQILSLNWRVAVSLNLGMLGGACNMPAVISAVRLHRPDYSAPRLDAWQAQLKVALGLAALPLGSLAVLLLIKSTYLLFAVTSLLTVVSAVLLAIAYPGPRRPPSALPRPDRRKHTSI